MLGYMTKKDAISHGFTNHGSYYGVPLWMSDDADCPMVAAKWAPMELVITLFHYIEGLAFYLNYGEEAEPCFMFKMGRALVD